MLQIGHSRSYVDIHIYSTEHNMIIETICKDGHVIIIIP